MGISIIEDVRGAGALTASFTEVIAPRRFFVTGLPGPDYALAFQAARAVDSTSGYAIPVLGTPHPYEPLAIVNHISVDVDRGNSSGYVVCSYEYKTVGSSQGFLESYTGSFTEFETHYDATGALATVTYTDAASKTHTRVAALKRKALCANIEFEFETTTSPRSTVTGAAGCINNAAWLGYGVRTLLCLPPVGTTKDGIVWKVRYGFAYRPYTWDQWEAYKDHAGLVPTAVASSIATSLSDPTVMSGNGWGRFIVFPVADFSTAFPGIN